VQLADKGTPYPRTCGGSRSEADVLAAMSESFDEPIILPPGETWRLPAGAFGESCGPT
jgi:hypothetical protein